MAADCARGWSYVDQELEEGLRSVAVPIVDRRKKIIAAMNISGQANRNTEEGMIGRFLPKLQKAAAQINAALRLRSIA